MHPGGGRRRRSLWIVVLIALAPLCAIAGGLGYVEYVQLAQVVDQKFAGRRWDFPSRIFADEFLIYVGMDVAASGLPRRLERLRYREVDTAAAAGGELRRSPAGFEIALRAGARGRSQTQHVRLDVDDGRVTTITDLDKDERLAQVALEPEELTGIYEGEWKERRAIHVTDVRPILIRAILVTEDSRFFNHHGIDAVGIARAALANLRSGGVRQGGSTLTQQLMKNFFLSSDRTLKRKLNEIAMALVAETRYSKMQILENYLNEIYLGQRGARGIFGVAEAAQFYFGKDPRDLDVAEVALIAGLIRAPNAYSPYHSPERAMERRNTVLRLLLEAGEIDQPTYDAACKSPLGVVAPREDTDDAPFFVDYVKSELVGRFPAQVLTSEGLKIYTTLDPLLEEEAQRAVSGGILKLETDHPRLKRAEQDDRLEGALIAIAPHTGEIKALVGGRHYQESQFNRVTQSLRQPGSVFKPIVYLTALLANGDGRVTPTTILDDSPFTWLYDQDREWSPRNYKDRYLGMVTARTALEQSLNAATARVAQGVGIDAVVALAHSLGITSTLPAVPALTLGAADVGLLEMTTAYAVFANGGSRAEPIAIKRVESREGDLIVGTPPVLSAVIAPPAAFVLTHMLEGVLDRGTGRGARAAGFRRPSAGKTGTTNDYRDAWFIGYTPDLLASVWVGFDHRSALDLSGGQAALPIWTDFMKQATAADPPRPFIEPPGVTMVRVDRTTGRAVAADEAGSGASEDIIDEAFLAEEPADSGGTLETPDGEQVRPAEDRAAPPDADENPPAQFEEPAPDEDESNPPRSHGHGGEEAPDEAPHPDGLREEPLA